jgi:RNA polymerase sigma-70 factor (ECF subfamily)
LLASFFYERHIRALDEGEGMLLAQVESHRARARVKRPPVSAGGISSVDQGEVPPEVVSAAQRGDAHAFETILRHYDRRLRVIADRVLNDRQAMDDALQEVAIKALRGLPSYRGDAPLGAWLCRIATTTCLDHLRRLRPEDPMAPDELPPSHVEGSDPSDGLDARERLRAALLSLPAEQRAAVVLVDQFGYDYHTTAVALGVPVGTAASRVATARGRLRAALAAGREEER